MLDEIGKNEDIEKNGMKIICDPYLKKINYMWRAAGRDYYEGLDPKASTLLNKKNTDTSIQKRASAILKEIAETYNTGTEGMIISFLGTQEDYDDFCEVLNEEYSESKIECIKDASYFVDAKPAIEKINNQFAGIKEVLGNYQEDEDIKNLIMKYEDAIKPVVPLCVVGLYSSGKSAFINSLIGEELLPSDGDPMTAHVCKISRSRKNQYIIRFKFDGEDCELKFKDNKYYPGNNGELDIIRKLDAIKDVETNEIGHMNQALLILNQYNAENEKHEMSDVIEIELPYEHSQLANGEFDFVIYDTPGSNSDSNLMHFDILERSIDNQTNALPILITNPDSLDATDNDKLISKIDKMGSSIDKTNAMVVINKADIKSMKTLGKKDPDKLKTTKWKPTEIFYLSAVMGIAGKMENPNEEEAWIDEDMFATYDKNQGCFGQSGIMQLYTLNQRKSEWKELGDRVCYNPYLYRNSGLESIENEIIEYARKYALYNKCQNASVYFQKALNLCGSKVVTAKDKLQEKVDEVKESFDDQSQDLIDKLNEKKNLTAVYNKEFQENMGKIYSSYKNMYMLDKKPKETAFYKDIINIFTNMKKEAKKEENEEKRMKKKEREKRRELRHIESYVNERYNGMLNQISDEARHMSGNYWKEKSSDFKQACAKVIHDDATLMNEKQNHLLNSILLYVDFIPQERVYLNLRDKKVINKRILSRREKFDPLECCKAIKIELDKEVSRRSTEAERASGEEFGQWVDALICLLTKELCTFNSKLDHLKDEITLLENKLEEQEECESKIRESSEFIKNLLEVHEVFDDEE